MIGMLPELIALIFLVILSYLDIKTFDIKGGFIPSFLTTSFIIIEFILVGVSCIPVGLFAGLICLLLIDLNVFQGIPDIKIFIALGLIMPSIQAVAVLGLFTSLGLLIYKLFSKKTTIPGIPFMLIAYALTMGVLLLW